MESKMTQPTAQKPAKPEANTPNDKTDAAHRSGQFGADEPEVAENPPAKRPADKTPNTKGPQFEEGGEYPGKRPGGK
jgi:hypothetical protein